MTTPNLEQLKAHRSRLVDCATFASFLTVQLEFVDMLIRLLEKEDKELRAAAREILGQ